MEGERFDIVDVIARCGELVVKNEIGDRVFGLVTVGYYLAKAGASHFDRALIACADVKVSAVTAVGDVEIVDS